MKSLPNIEKSGARRGEYVGYSDGRVWRIRRNDGYARSRFAWIAQVQTGDHDVVYAGTLARLSEKLERKAASGIPCGNMREFDKVMP